MRQQQGVPWDSEWIELPGFPGYWLSQYGQVFNLKRGALVSQYRNQHGVLSVRLYGRLTSEVARGHSRSVPKLVRETFGREVAPAPAGPLRL